jgi:hypothetical protein
LGRYTAHRGVPCKFWIFPLSLTFTRDRPAYLCLGWRRVTMAGAVSTVAGNGEAGVADGLRGSRGSCPPPGASGYSLVACARLQCCPAKRSRVLQRHPSLHPTRRPPMPWAPFAVRACARMRARGRHITTRVRPCMHAAEAGGAHSLPAAARAREPSPRPDCGAGPAPAARPCGAARSPAAARGSGCAAAVGCIRGGFRFGRAGPAGRPLVAVCQQLRARPASRPVAEGSSSSAAVASHGHLVPASVAALVVSCARWWRPSLPGARRHGRASDSQALVRLLQLTTASALAASFLPALLCSWRGAVGRRAGCMLSS